MYSAAETPLRARQKRARKPTNLVMCLSPKLNGTNAPILYDLANIAYEAPPQVTNRGSAPKENPRRSIRNTAGAPKGGAI